MRFQALMPDILHWLGITKIDRMLSMSNMKYDAIVSQGIPILERVPIPDDMIPEDGQVEIEAKVHAGYFAGQPGEAASRWTGELEGIKGRGWDDIDVCSQVSSLTFSIKCFLQEWQSLSGSYFGDLECLLD
jgi:hypothetical protein